MLYSRCVGCHFTCAAGCVDRLTSPDLLHERRHMQQVGAARR